MTWFLKKTTVNLFYCDQAQAIREGILEALEEELNLSITHIAVIENLSVGNGKNPQQVVGECSHILYKA